MQEKQARMQKRVRYEDGQNATAFASADESDDGRAGDEEGAGAGVTAGANEYADGTKKAPEDYEDYVDVSATQIVNNLQILHFTENQRRQKRPEQDELL